MSFITDSLFGGASRDAARQQTDAMNQAVRTQQQAAAEARDAMIPRFDEASVIRRQGQQGALDFLSGIQPFAADMAIQGNVAAQNRLGFGGNQAMNAILGNQIQEFQPATQISYNPNIFNSPDIANILAGTQEAPQADVGVPPSTPGTPWTGNPYSGGYSNPFGGFHNLRIE